MNITVECVACGFKKSIDTEEEYVTCPRCGSKDIAFEAKSK